jgi:hypothetical protein
MDSRWVLVVSGLVVLASPGGGSGDGGGTSRSGPPRNPPAIVAGYRVVPSTFERNDGQGPSGSSFLYRTTDWLAAIDGSGAWLWPRPGEGGPVGIRFPGAGTGGAPRGISATSTRSNFMLGRDRSRWVTGVPHFGGVEADADGKGARVRWSVTPAGNLRYDVHVPSPGIAVDIAMDFPGATAAELDPAGALVVRGPWGVLRHTPPVAWQQGAVRRHVPSSFALDGNGATLRARELDPGVPLVIDPTLEVDTIFAPGYAPVRGVAIDSSGDVFVGGHTSSTGLASSFAYQNYKKNTVGTYRDAFLAKFERGSSAIAWFTYFGGRWDDDLAGIAVDGLGSIWIAGTTRSDDLPVTPGAFQSTSGGVGDAFLCRISPGGDFLEASTYLGGAGEEVAGGVAVDAGGRPWIAGYSLSTAFPLKDAFDSTYSGGEAFVSRLDSGATALGFSSFFGGGSWESFTSIAISDDGRIWAVGGAGSTDIATKYPVQSSHGGGSEDAIIVGLSADGKTVEFASYMGGSGQDRATAVAVDLHGNPCIGGFTGSAGFPTVAPYQSGVGGGSGTDAFLAKIQTSTLTVSYATFLGGANSDHANCVAADPEGNLLAGGATRSSDFPLLDATDSTYNSTEGNNEDMFLSKLSANGSTYLFGTFRGGARDDEYYALAADGSVAAGVGRHTNTSTNQQEGVLTVTRFLPDPPLRLRTGAGSPGQVALVWDDVHGGAYGAEVQRRIGLGAFTTIANIAAGATGYADTTAAEGTSPQYRVRGTSAGGNTGWSSSLRVLVPLRAPESPVATATSNTSVSLTWTDASAVETGYQVFRRAGVSGMFSLVASRPAGSVSWNDGTVLPERTYQYQVRTLGPAGSTADSVIATVVTPPKDPGAFFATAQDDQTVTLTWTDASLVETGYEIQRRDEEAGGVFATIALLGAGSELYTNGGLEANHGYSWRARTLGAAGTSGWSAPSALVTPPLPPTSLEVAARDSESATVSWVHDHPGETGFAIQVQEAGEADFRIAGTAPPNATSGVASGLRQKSDYLLRVKATSYGGSSRAVETVAVKTAGALYVAKARLKPASGSKAARLEVSGRFDSGPVVPDFGSAGAVEVDGARTDVPEFTEAGSGFRYEGEGVTLGLKPSKGGGSSVSFTLAVEGGGAATLSPDGSATLAIEAGGVEFTGRFTLQGGVLDPAKGVGALDSPSAQITALRISTAKPGRHTVHLAARFAPFTGDDGAPDVRLVLGDALDASFDGSAFSEKKGTWSMKSKGPPAWSLSVDPAAGTIVVKGSGLDLGSFPAGTHAVPILLEVGPRRYEDEPLLVSTGKGLGF